MFELPEAKRVRREDLNGSDASDDDGSEVDAEIRAQLEAQMARSLGLDVEKPAKASQQTSTASLSLASKPHIRDEKGAGGVDVSMNDAGPGDGGGDDDDEDHREEYDFCLFGGSGGAKATKVVLEDEREPQGEGGLAAPRPMSYCVAPKYSQEQRKAFQVSAVTGDDVIARSSWRAWSLEMPWKVTHITVKTKKKSNGDGSLVVQEEDDEEKQKRRRPGKKRRMAMRTKERAKKEEAKTAAQLREEKEEHLKEKKKRANRAKKLRKRAKGREQKAEAGGDRPEGDDSEGSG